MLNDVTPSPALRFSLLGPVRAWRGAEEVDLGSPQQRTTLAVLLLHEGAVVTVDQLIAAVWGDDAPRSAMTTIRTYVSRLRRVLGGAAAIKSLAGGYSLSVPADALDVVRLRRQTALATQATRQGNLLAAAAHLRSALELRRGRPLAGAGGPYAQNQRTRLEQTLVNAEVDLLGAEISNGRHREVLPELTAKVDEYPLWEQVQELFMTALHRSGRPAEAITHYLVARRKLVEELGIEPGVRLRDLHRRILSGEEEAASAPAPMRRTITRRSLTRTARSHRMHRAAAGV